MKSERPLDPLNDLYIHYLFGSEENKDIALDFINAVFEQKGQPRIVSLEIMNPINIAKYKIGKLSSVDIKARTQEEQTIIIEVQRQSQSYFADRSLYYWAYNYQKQLKTAESFATLHPVMCINLLDFTLFPEIEAFHTCFHIAEMNQPDYILSEHLQIHFIELSKPAFDSEMQLPNAFEQWCYYFKKEGYLEDKEMTVLLHNNKTIEKAHALYSKFSSDSEQMAMLEEQEKWELDYRSSMNASWNEGLEKGMEKGKVEGKIEGKKEGITQAAKGMKASGADMELIRMATGLSMDEIKKL